MKRQKKLASVIVFLGLILTLASISNANATMFMLICQGNGTAVAKNRGVTVMQCSPNNPIQIVSVAPDPSNTLTNASPVVFFSGNSNFLNWQITSYQPYSSLVATNRAHTLVAVPSPRRYVIRAIFQ